MKYQVLQIHVTDAEVDLINETGDFNAVPKFTAQLKMRRQFDGNIAEIAKNAFNSGYFTHVANITASDLDHVFQISNMGLEENIERLDRMHSVSVGDIIIDENNIVWVVANFGFEEVMELEEVFEWEAA